MIPDGHKRMLLDSAAADIVNTPAVSGVPANFLKDSLRAAGIDPKAAGTPEMDLGLELAEAGKGGGNKPWRDIWSAGQGVGRVRDLPTVAELVERMKNEYLVANAVHVERSAFWSRSGENRP